MADVTYPPEFLPEADDPETAEVIVGGAAIDWPAVEKQLITELRHFNEVCRHLINVINEGNDATKH